MKNQIINNSLSTENFSKSYPFLNKYLFENADFVNSRNGDTKEILNFKTELTNPYKRCVGNNERGVNIFFLLAEAIWIFRGRKDVQFLEIFNSKMKDYSDDGKVFHAPYGFRMRHYGVSSFDVIKPLGEEQNHAANQLIDGTDQIFDSIQMLSEDAESRRVVISIWNPELDLGTNSKDLPCNDLLMLKIRNNKLHSTISNRSNDLHWGLPTNIFQFSFVTEVISNVLGIELGTQVHNSQSLHFYLDNDIAMKMYENLQFSNSDFVDLYDFTQPFKIDMKFSGDSIYLKLQEVDYFLDLIINSILSGVKLDDSKQIDLGIFSEFLLFTYRLLWVYNEYKFEQKDELVKVNYYNSIKNDFSDYSNTDLYALALNFFASRIPEKYRTDNNIIGKL
jgi:thymidylate synthase